MKNSNDSFTIWDKQIERSLRIYINKRIIITKIRREKLIWQYLCYGNVRNVEGKLWHLRNRGQVIQIMGNALKGENTGGQKVTNEVERMNLCILTKKSQG